VCLVGVEDEADALQYPVAGVLGRMKVRLEHESDAHRVAALRRHVDRSTQSVLQLELVGLDWNDLDHRHRLHQHTHTGI